MSRRGPIYPDFRYSKRDQTWLHWQFYVGGRAAKAQSLSGLLSVVSGLLDILVHWLKNLQFLSGLETNVRLRRPKYILLGHFSGGTLPSLRKIPRHLTLSTVFMCWFQSYVILTVYPAVQRLKMVFREHEGNDGMIMDCCFSQTIIYVLKEDGGKGTIVILYKKPYNLRKG